MENFKEILEKKNIKEGTNVTFFDGNIRKAEGYVKSIDLEKGKLTLHNDVTIPINKNLEQYSRYFLKELDQNNLNYFKQKGVDLNKMFYTSGNSHKEARKILGGDNGNVLTRSLTLEKDGKKEIITIKSRPYIGVLKNNNGQLLLNENQVPKIGLKYKDGQSMERFLSNDYNPVQLQLTKEDKNILAEKGFIVKDIYYKSNQGEAKKALLTFDRELNKVNNLPLSYLAKVNKISIEDVEKSLKGESVKSSNQKEISINIDLVNPRKTRYKLVNQKLDKNTTDEKKTLKANKVKL